MVILAHSYGQNPLFSLDIHVRLISDYMSVFWQWIEVKSDRVYESKLVCASLALMLLVDCLISDFLGTNRLSVNCSSV